ncbi:13129_t:CDS:2 [Entrophospora sp. SA101]|nr:6153_t:CDS:2 [Entrophospora sp. SA101]CAJ0839061.1 13129_t:CDS:2 [Entrophospora sp. SA101]
MASFFSRQINFLKKSAEERPAYFWSLAIGFIGPIGVLVIPDIRRKYFGYEPPLPFPTTYPSKFKIQEELIRPRNPPIGYEDP